MFYFSVFKFNIFWKKRVAIYYKELFLGYTKYCHWIFVVFLACRSSPVVSFNAQWIVILHTSLHFKSNGHCFRGEVPPPLHTYTFSLREIAGKFFNETEGIKCCNSFISVHRIYIPFKKILVKESNQFNEKRPCNLFSVKSIL